MQRITVLVATVIMAVGLLAASGCSPAPSATASGGQTIRVSSQGQFVPETAARAGVPITLEFGPGADCTAAIQFTQYGIFEDLTDGGGVVQLPALDPGRYPLICQSNMSMGELVVQ